MGRMVAGAAVAVFASNLANFLGADSIDRGVIRPFHQKVWEIIQIVAVIHLRSPNNPPYDRFACLHVDDIQQIFGYFRADTVELFTWRDPVFWLASDKVHPDATMREVVGDHEALSGCRINRGLGPSWRIINPGENQFLHRLKASSQLAGKLLPAPSQWGVQFIHESRGWRWLRLGISFWSFRDSESQQDLIQQELSVVLRSHAMPGREHHSRIIVHVLQELPYCRIDGNIHVLHRISYKTGHLLLVPRVSGIMQVPALMTGTMTFCEDLRKQIPPALSQKMLGQFCLCRDAAHKTVSKRFEIVDVTRGVAIAPPGVIPEASDDLLCERRWRGKESVLCVMRAPFHQLNAVQVLRRSTQG